MRVCVAGLWHLGTVIAACLSSAGHRVVGLDSNADTIARLRSGLSPVYEPGLNELLSRSLQEGTLTFTTDASEALRNGEVAWVAYDTPVDENDRADAEAVVTSVRQLFPYLEAGMVVLVSSQLPVGTTGRLEQAYRAAYPAKRPSVCFCYSPENLRLGQAISVFRQPDRVVVGTRSTTERERLSELLRPFTERIEWMSVESAEMTKHAINTFLAASVALTNEIASLGEQFGADALEVERGLRTESRIGPRAYVSPGAAFAGGTLARDVSYLAELGVGKQVPLHVIEAICASNDAHRHWPRRKLIELLGNLEGKTVAVWGLTYKPGTDTLRRSSAVELCLWLSEQGARAHAHDPAVQSLPSNLSHAVTFHTAPLDALVDAVALVIATEWPDYREVNSDEVVSRMSVPLVIDASRFLRTTLGKDSRIKYVSVGTPRIPD